MTAEQIRNMPLSGEDYTDWEQTGLTQAILREIAAQLCETNDLLHSVISGPGKIRRIQVDSRTYDQSQI